MVIRTLALVCSLGLATSVSADVWEKYRSAHPFHIQEIAISKAVDGTRTIIISEPPAHFPEKIDEIDTKIELAFGPNTITDVEIRRHKVMLDGWVEDVTATINYDLEERTIADAVAALSRDLFGTTYGAYYRDLNRDEPFAAANAPSNVSISPADLHFWLIKQESAMMLPDGSAAGTLPTLLSAGSVGTFTTKDRHLVAWVLDPKTAFVRNDRDAGTADWIERAHFREFTLASDLILGAVHDLDSGMISVIGQARTVPLDSLPPLRFETLRRLAAAAEGDRSLGQSYERRSAYAGSLTEGTYEGWDWAPIFLSDHLQDTEFGSLLNITDQILKSWSLAGDIEYLNFPYPSPESIPFGGRLDEKILEVNPLSQGTLFNWNTTGAATVVVFEGYEIATPLRTGSLPITYGSEFAGETSVGELTAEFEEEGWDYFSGLRDPNLTRVVQYSFLYQIFEDWKVANDDRFDRDGLPSQRIAKNLGTFTSRLLSRLERGLIPENGMARLQKEAQDDDDPLLALGNIMLRSLVDSAKEEVDLFYSIAPDGRDLLIRAIVAPRSFEIDFDDPKLAAFQVALETAISSEDHERVLREHLKSPIVRKVYALQMARTIGPVLGIYEDGEKAMDTILAAAQGMPFNGNVKTPSVVLSRDKKALGVGGHSLNSAMPRIRLDATIARGEVRATPRPGGEVEIRINPNDASGSGMLGRRAARSPETDPARLGKELSGALTNTPPRSLREALGNPKLLSEPALGALRPVNRTVDQTLVEKLDAAKENAVRVLEGSDANLMLTRTENEVWMLSWGRPPSHVPLATRSASIEAAQKLIESGKYGNSIALTGVSKSEVQALHQSIANAKSDPAILRPITEGGGSGRPPNGPPVYRLFDGREPPRGGSGASGKPPAGSNRVFRIVTQRPRDEVGQILMNTPELVARAESKSAVRSESIDSIPDFVQREIPEGAELHGHFVIEFQGTRPFRPTEDAFAMGAVTLGKLQAVGVDAINSALSLVGKRVPDARFKQFSRAFRDEILGGATTPDVILYLNPGGEIGWTMYSINFQDGSVRQVNSG